MPSEAITTKPPELSREQIELVKSTVAKGATDEELKLFLYVCKIRGLDPLARQIHAIKRYSGDELQLTIQTGIDGYRVIAERTGSYAGNDDPVFGPEVQEPWGKRPEWATATIWKMVGGQRYAFAATARWAEYFPSHEKSQFFWKKMPYGQLAKCAEALALRKAFPNDLSGVYTDEEMQQAGPEATVIAGQVMEANTKEAAKATADAKIKELQAKLEQTRPGGNAEAEIKKEMAQTTAAPDAKGGKITPPQAKRLFAIAMKSGKSKGLFDDHTKLRLRDWLRTEFGINHTKEILASQYDNIISEIQKGEMFKPNFKGSAVPQSGVAQSEPKTPRPSTERLETADEAFNQAQDELGNIPF